MIFVHSRMVRHRSDGPSLLVKHPQTSALIMNIFISTRFRRKLFGSYDIFLTALSEDRKPEVSVLRKGSTYEDFFTSIYGRSP